MTATTVIGKRGPGAMRVEWTFQSITDNSCERVVHIFGSCGACLVTMEPETIDRNAYVAAVECMDACPDDRRTVKANR